MSATAFLLALAAAGCGGGGEGVSVARPTTTTAVVTTTTTVATTTTTAPPFPVTVDAYVQRFNSVQLPLLALQGTSYGELRAVKAYPGLFGGEVGSGEAVYVGALSPGDGVQYVVVASAAGAGGSVTTPTRLISAAMTNIFDPASEAAVLETFRTTVIPQLGQITKTVTTFKVGDYVDLNVVVLGPSKLAFVVTRIGSGVPSQVHELPST